jgi:hypothetical protein
MAARELKDIPAAHYAAFYTVLSTDAAQPEASAQSVQELVCQSCAIRLRC